MSFLTDTAGFAADIEAEFVDTVIISRPGVSADSEGNPTGALTAVVTVDGLFIPPTSGSTDLVLLAGQAGQELDGWVILPLDTDVQPGDWITVMSSSWTVTRVIVGRTILRAMLHRTER